VKWLEGLWNQCQVLENDGFYRVLIEVYPLGADWLIASGSGTCAEYSHLHPVTGEPVYGVVLTDLAPEEVFIVVWVEDVDGNEIAYVASARDIDGNDIALQGGNIPMKLDPGDHHTVSVTLSKD
jgi:hypothetical protein